MKGFAYVIILAWPLAVVALFALARPRRAAIGAFVGAWLFLPMVGIPIAGLPDYTKMSATSLGILLGVAIFDPGRFLSFRPRLIDLPMLVWCLCPFVSGMANGFELYANAAAVVAQMIAWGLPYLIGRLYFTDMDALRELALGLLIGGLVYVPIIVFESRMSPQLHTWLYGFRPAAQKVRDVWLFGPLGYTPIGFVGNYLGLTMLMGATSVLGVWLWVTGALRRILGLPVRYAVPAICAGAILCKAWGANAIWMATVGAMLLARGMRSPLPLMCLVLLPPIYMVARGTGAWSGEGLVRLIQEDMSERRADSLNVRLRNEDILVEKALRRPALGWGPWGDYRVTNDEGQDICLTDGLWVISLGKYGLVGLAALMMAYLLPSGLLLASGPRGWWATPSTAHVAAIAMVMAAHMTDALFNAQPNPVFALALGGLSGVAGAGLPAYATLASARRVAARSAARVPSA